MLKAHGLYKSYGSTAAVVDVALSVAPGEIVGFLGPNGAGKSTTAAMISGITAPDAGEITIDGQVLGRGACTAKSLVGLVPQNLALIEDLSAFDNLVLFGSLYGLHGVQLRSRAMDALELVGLVDKAKSRCANFSGGMKRRLNIACALVHDPSVLVLDEPTVGIDPQSRNRIFENLETLRARGKALLYTTHYMEEVQRLCNRIVIIDHGRVIADDTQENLRSQLSTGAPQRYEISGPVTPALLANLQAQGVQARPLDAVSLEEVFLHLTGSELRDAS